MVGVEMVKSEGQELNELMRNYIEAQKNLVKDNGVTLMSVGLVGTLGGVTLMVAGIVGVVLPPLSFFALGTAAASFSIGFYASKNFKEIFSDGLRVSKEGSETKVELTKARDNLTDYLSNLIQEPEKYQSAFQDVDRRLLNKIWKEHCVKKKKGMMEKAWDSLTKKSHSFDGLMKETFENNFDKNDDFRKNVLKNEFGMEKGAAMSSVFDAFKFAHGKNERKSNLTFKEKITNGFKVGYGVANLAVFTVGILATLSVIAIPIVIPGAISFFCLTTGALSLIKGVKDIKKTKNLGKRDHIIEENRMQKANDLYEKIAGKTYEEIAAEKDVSKAEITQIVKIAYVNGYHRILGSLNEQDPEKFKRSLRSMDVNVKQTNLDFMLGAYEDDKKKGKIQEIDRPSSEKDLGQASGQKQQQADFHVATNAEKAIHQKIFERHMKRLRLQRQNGGHDPRSLGS